MQAETDAGDAVAAACVTLRATDDAAILGSSRNRKIAGVFDAPGRGDGGY